MFTNKTRKISFETSPTDGDSPPVFATVLEVKDNRCKVQLFSGEDIDDVKLPGGYPEMSGKGHGVFGGVSVNQLVLVEFLFGSCQNPVIAQAYPFTARKKDNENFKMFNSINNIKVTDIVIFHKSGYSVWLTDDKVIVKKLVVPVLTLDLQTMLIETMLGLSLGNVPVSNGTLLNAFLLGINTHLTELNTKVLAIQTALINSPTTPTDGGLTYKTAIAAALANNTLPVTINPVPVDLNNTNLKQAAV
jgi:hypothetical protein